MAAMSTGARSRSVESSSRSSAALSMSWRTSPDTVARGGRPASALSRCVYVDTRARTRRRRPAVVRPGHLPGALRAHAPGRRLSHEVAVSEPDEARPNAMPGTMATCSHAGSAASTLGCDGPAVRVARRSLRLPRCRFSRRVQYQCSMGGSRALAPTVGAMQIYRSFALLAQLVEHFHGKEGVAGSSPAEGSGEAAANSGFSYVSGC
jgi:hypothetical protein